MRRVPFILAVMVSLALGTPALAQIQPGAYSISPLVGGFVFEGSQNLKQGPVYGLRLGYNFTKNWGAEAVFDYVPTNSLKTPTRNDIKTNVYNYRVEGLYHFIPDSKVVPFLTAGAGGMTTNYRENTDDKTRPTVDLGAGLKCFVTEWLAIRGEVRHIMAFGSVYNNLEYGLGLTFSFGGSRSATPKQ